MDAEIVAVMTIGALWLACVHETVVEGKLPPLPEPNSCFPAVPLALLPISSHSRKPASLWLLFATPAIFKRAAIAPRRADQVELKWAIRYQGSTVIVTVVVPDPVEP